MKYTPPDDAEYEILSRACQCINKVVDKINSEKAKKENSEKILNIISIVDFGGVHKMDYSNVFLFYDLSQSTSLKILNCYNLVEC